MCCTGVCRETCLGHSCIHDGGCAGARCCGLARKRKCLETCIGEPCDDDADCSLGSSCCERVEKCQNDCEDDYPLVSQVAGYAGGISFYYSCSYVVVTGLGGPPPLVAAFCGEEIDKRMV